LEETYERILRGIHRAQRDDARRLLQCLAVAARPLRVKEIAELLVFDCQAPRSGGIPKLENWRWDNHEEAVLSTCSSLIAIVGSGASRAVQFSHFSVKGYLTSPRLARSHEEVSRFHIDLDAAHTIMAKACLGTLLRLDEHIADSGAKGFPLVEYAAQHWVGHAQFENVSSHLQDEMDDLFDTSKPYFAAWLRVHDIDESWRLFSNQLQSSSRGDGSPLYYAAFCGFYELVERLIMKDPEEVNEESGWIRAPLPAALYKRHFRVADLLYRHGADVEVRGDYEKTPLHIASWCGDVDIMRWLFDHGADANIWDEARTTPLYLAAMGMHLEAAQMLLDHNADPNWQHNEGTPLHWALAEDLSLIDEEVLNFDVDVVRLLLEHGADVTISDSLLHSTALHRASSGGWLEVVRLLLSYGAKVDEKDKLGRTPFQIASSRGHLEIMKYLSENGAVVGVRDNKEGTPLHDASAGGHIDAMQWLLNHGADANARQCDCCTPLHLAAYEHLEAVHLLLEHNVDVNSQDDKGETPLHKACVFARIFQKEGVVDIVRRLLEHGADPNIRDHSLSAPLHLASSEGLLEAARLLISYGAKVDEKDGKGMSPFQVAASEGHRELTKLLLEHSSVP
jgi:ankyrin repeat protein